ncbi:MAG: DUF4880 domain-containing protein [Pseudomonadota bacterium]
MSEDPSDPPEDVVDQAIAWMVRMQSGEMTDEERAKLDVWRAADLNHETAWLRLVEIEGDFSGIAPEDRETARKTLDLARKRNNRRDTLKMLAGGVASGGLLWGASQTPTARRFMADYATTVGEQNRVLLGGAEIRLNTDTILDVDRAARRVRLRRGEINVAVTGGGVLSTETEHGLFSATDARFVLRNLGEAGRIAVIQGTATLSPRRQPQAVIEATSGDSFYVTHDDAAPARLFERMDPDAWLEGLLVVRRMRLGEVVGELNRYRSGLIRVAPGVAPLEVSGVYRLDAVDEALGALEAQLPVRVARYTRFLTTIGPI